MVISKTLQAFCGLRRLWGDLSTVNGAFLQKHQFDYSNYELFQHGKRFALDRSIKLLLIFKVFGKVWAANRWDKDRAGVF